MKGIKFFSKKLWDVMRLACNKFTPDFLNRRNQGSPDKRETWDAG